jgi:hypothetical protein
MTNHADKNDNYTKRKRKHTRNAQPSDKIERTVSGPRPSRDTNLPCARFVYADVSTKGLSSNTTLPCVWFGSYVFNKGLQSKTELEEKLSSKSSVVSFPSSSSSASGPVTEVNEVFLDRAIFINRTKSEDSDSSDDESSQKLQKAVYTFNHCSLPAI